MSNGQILCNGNFLLLHRFRKLRFHAFNLFLIILIFLQVSAIAVLAEEEIPDMFRGVKKEVLDNGLTIITLNREDSAMVSINIFVNTGSINEDDQTTGISHFCEHLFYRGTETRTGIEMKREIEQLGGKFNAETTRDYTRFFVNVPSEYGLKALEIYCDAALNANYPAELIEKERKVIIEEYNLTQQDPARMVHEKIYSMAFSSHPYRRPTIGTLKSLKSFTRDDFLQYKKTFYSPENMTIVLVGKFDRTKYMNVIKEYFKGIAGGFAGRDSRHQPEPPLSVHKEVIEEKPIGTDKALFAMAYRSPGIQDQQDVLAMDLLVFMLGQGKNSRLNVELGKKRKLVTEMGADFFTSKDPGLVIFSAEVVPDQVEKVREALFTVLFDIKKGKFTEDELEIARRMLIKTYLYGNETNEGRADALGFYETLTGMDFALDYIKRIKKVTKEDIVRVANKYFGDGYVLYVVKPAKMSNGR